MAEYIDRDKVLECRDTIVTDDYDGNETLDVVLTEDILELTPADVVEREEYDLLKRQLADAWNRIDELDKLNGLIQEKIDKAVEEMNTLPKDYEYELGVSACLEILKRNIESCESK